MVLCFGEPYRDGATALRLLSPVVIFLFHEIHLRLYLYGSGMQQVFMACMAASLWPMPDGLTLIPFYIYRSGAREFVLGRSVLFLWASSCCDGLEAA